MNMFRPLSQCFSSTFLRQNMFFQRANISNITFASASHSRVYHSTAPSPQNHLDDDQSSQQQQGHPSWQFFTNFANAQSAAEQYPAAEIWERKSFETRLALQSIPLANAYTGRCVRVSNGDVGEAYKRLDIRLARNRVRYELKRAERHEKKGAKRRRLTSERWRMRFADEVRKKIALVKAIRRRGA